MNNRSWDLEIDDLIIESYPNYSEVEQGQLVSLIGSHGYVEIAVNSGNAKMTLDKNYGDVIEVKIKQ